MSIASVAATAATTSWDAAGTDRVELGADITEVDVSLADAGSALQLTLNTGETLRFDSQFTSDGSTNAGYAVEAIRFADGTEWDLARIKIEALKATSGADTRYGLPTTASTAAAATTSCTAATATTRCSAATATTPSKASATTRWMGVQGDDTLSGGEGADLVAGGAGTDLPQRRCRRRRLERGPRQRLPLRRRGQRCLSLRSRRGQRLRVGLRRS